MWSLAYGLIALAVVAFVVLYAAAHTPNLTSVNLADQLYGAKGWLAGNLPSFPKVELTSRFRVFVNVVRVVKVNATAYDYRTRQWVVFPVYLPMGYRLEREGGNVVYQIYLNVTRCRNATLPRGEPAMLYEIELKHSLDQLPWLEVYAAVLRNITQYYNWLYGYYTAWRMPPAVGLTPRIGADDEFVELVKAEHVLVYNATSDTAKLYVAAPAAALYVLLVDYPLKLPLTCSEQFASVSASSGSQRSDTPTTDFPSPR